MIRLWYLRARALLLWYHYTELLDMQAKYAEWLRGIKPPIYDAQCKYEMLQRKITATEVACARVTQ